MNNLIRSVVYSLPLLLMAGVSQNLRAEDKSATREGIVKLPTAGGTVQKDENSFSFSTAYGGLSYSVALPSLPDRGGLSPNLTLNYSQNSGDNGSGFGIGWSLNASAIYVNDDLGTAIRQRHPNHDFFSHLSLDGQRLISLYLEDESQDPQFALESTSSATKVIYTKKPRDIKVREANGGLRTVHFPGGFIVSHPNGRIAYYAESRSSAEWDLNDANHATRWPITLMVTPNGEAVEYNYHKQMLPNKEGQLQPAGRSYLKEVSFAGGASRYVFELVDTRASLVSYRSAFRLTNEYVYGGIKAYFKSQLQGSLCFAYTGRSEIGDDFTVRAGTSCLAEARKDLAADISSQRSLNVLDQLRVVYRSGNSAQYDAAKDQPKVRFHYSNWFEQDETKSVVFDVPALANTNPRSQLFELFDANLDSLVDIISTSNGVSSVKYGKDSLDSSFDTESEWTLERDGQVIRPRIDQEAFHFADINGDSLVDLLEVGNGQLFVYMRQAKGKLIYTGSPIALPWIKPSLFADQSHKWMDLNGDGLTDILATSSENGRTYWKAYINQTMNVSGSFEFALKATTLSLPASYSASVISDVDSLFSDVNGDQLVDFIRIKPAQQGLCLYENQGDVYGKQDTLLFKYEHPSTLDRSNCDQGRFIQVSGLAQGQALSGDRIWFMDANGDGIMDLLTFTDNDTVLKVWLGFGNGDFLQNPLSFSLLDDAGKPQINIGSAGRQTTRLTDLDGDGQTELIIFQSSSASFKPVKIIDFNRLEQTQLIKSNLLTSIESDSGLRYDLRYVSSIDERLRDKNNQMTEGVLHFPTYVVKQLVTSEMDPAGGYKPGREVMEMQYHEPYYDYQARKFVGFRWVETISYGDEYLGDAASQRSFYKREVFSNDYRMSGKLLESYTHEFTPTASFAEQSQETANLSLNDATLHGMKSYAQQQDIARSGRLIHSSIVQAELVDAFEGYNDEKAYFLRTNSIEEKYYGTDGSSSTNIKTYADYDAYNIFHSVIEHEGAVRSPYGIVIPEKTLKKSYGFDISRGQLADLGMIELPDFEKVFEIKGGLEVQVAEQTFTYDEKGWLKSNTKKSFVTLENPVQEWKAPADRTEEFRYDAFGNILSQSVNGILMESATYDAQGIFAIASANAIGQAFKVSYGPMPVEGCSSRSELYVPENQVGSYRDLVGTCHYLGYDKLGRRTSYERADGYSETYDYEWARKGAPLRILRKARRYLDSMPLPAGESREIKTLDAYSPRGEKMASLEVDESGRGVRVLQYKEFNRKGKTYQEWTPYLDQDTSIDSVFAHGVIPTHSRKAVIRYSYDGMGRLSSAHYPTGRSETMGYEPWGQKVDSTFKTDMEPTSKAVVKRGDLVYATIDALEHKTIYGYDVYGNIASILLPGETQARRYWYDSLGRKLKQCAPAIGCTWFTYNDLGYPEMRLVYDTAGKKQHTVGYLYDVLGRLLEVQNNGILIQRDSYDRYPAGAVPAAHALQNPIGFQTASAVFDGHKLYNVLKVFSYDRAGRIVEKTVNYEGAQARSYVERYTYTLDGATKSIVDPFNVRAEYRLAPSMRFIGMDVRLPWNPTKAETVIEDIRYSADGKISSIQYREGARSYLDYDPETLLLRAQQATYRDKALGDTFLQNTSLEIDGNGSITKIDDNVAVQTPYGKVNRSGTFVYNARDELVQFNRYGEQHTYTYDGAGNFQTNSELGELRVAPQGGTSLLPRSSDSIQYVFNSLGQLQSRRNLRPVPGSANDLQRSVDILDMKYDALGRLIYVKTATAQVFYGYDIDGYRLYKRVLANASAQPKDSLFPSKTVITEPSGDQSFVTIGSQRIVRIEHARTPLEAGTWYYYLLDHLGSTEFVMHADGTPVEQMIYRAYGAESDLNTLTEGQRFKTFQAQNQSKMPREKTHHRFTGQYLDDDSGLYYYGARYYDPLLGRFISPDPLFYGSPDKCIGNALACNLYTYAANNPMSKVDPLGLEDEPWYKEALGVAKDAVRGVSAGFIDSVPVVGSRYVDATAGEQSRTFQVTRALTNIGIGVVESAAGFVVGTGGSAGGGLACATGVGCAVGAPVAVGSVVAGAAMVTHGGAQIGMGINNLSKAWNNSGGGGGKPKDPVYENPGHHDPRGGNPNRYNPSKSVLPENHKELWAQSRQASDGNRWTKVGSGKKTEYHRFQNDGNGNWHWNGSTNGKTARGEERSIRMDDVPNEVKKW